jgi:hypothetical protein
MFDISRIFAQRSKQTDLMEWFFIGRNNEGIVGPFHNEEIAGLALQEFIKLKIEICDDGGRNAEPKPENINDTMTVKPIGESG